MTEYAIKARYVNIPRASVERMTYSDGSPALIARDLDEYETETLSVNLSYYGLTPPSNHVYVRDYSEHEGLPDALEQAGVVKVIERFQFGPHAAEAALVEVLV